MPRLSVIVTAFNIEQYIAQCLDSVTGQTLADLEIIVVDDGSSDGTPAIIQEYAQRDRRIVPVILEQNSVGGVATAANAGIDRATSPYVGFMDGDDYCEPTMFEKLLDAAGRHDADLAMCNYRLVDVATGEMSAPADSQKWSYLEDSYFALDVATQRRLLQFIAVPWRKIYRTELLRSQQLRFPVGDYFYEDNPFHWFTLLSARSIAFVPEVLCYHRYQREGQTMGTADARLLRIFDHHWSIQSFLIDRGLLDQFAPSLVSWVVGQAGWVSLRTPPHLRRDLFDRLHAILDGYEGFVVQEGMRMSRRGPRMKRLVHSARRNDYEAFCRALDEYEHGDADSELPPSQDVADPAQALRRSGLRETSRRVRALAQRAKAAAPRSAEGAPPAVTEPVSPDSSISNEDLMFALVVLQHRLDEAERQIRNMAVTLAEARAGEQPGHRAGGPD